MIHAITTHWVWTVTIINFIIGIYYAGTLHEDYYDYQHSAPLWKRLCGTFGTMLVGGVIVIAVMIYVFILEKIGEWFDKHFQIAFFWSWIFNREYWLAENKKSDNWLYTINKRMWKRRKEKWSPNLYFMRIGVKWINELNKYTFVSPEEKSIEAQQDALHSSM